MKHMIVKAGHFPKEQLPDLLKSRSIFINAYAERFFSHPEFSTDSCPDEMHVVIASLFEIDFQEGATLDEIFCALPKYHLKPCHLCTGLYLRIAYTDQEQSCNSVLTGTHQAPDHAITVLSRIPEPNDKSFPTGLYLRNVDGSLWLRGYTCDSSYRWSCKDMFAFEE